MEKCEAVWHCCIHHEAEFVACFKATIRVNWMWNFFLGIRVVDGLLF